MSLCPQFLDREGRAIPAAWFLERPGQPPPEAPSPSPPPPLSPQTQILLLSVGPLSEAPANLLELGRGVAWGGNSTEPLKDQGFFNFTRGDLTLVTQR